MAIGAILGVLSAGGSLYSSLRERSNIKKQAKFNSEKGALLKRIETINLQRQKMQQQEQLAGQFKQTARAGVDLDSPTAQLLMSQTSAQQTIDTEMMRAEYEFQMKQNSLEQSFLKRQARDVMINGLIGGLSSGAMVYGTFGGGSNKGYKVSEKPKVS